MESVLYETEMDASMPEDHHGKGLLEECNVEGVLNDTERDAFTDGETLSYAEESCQDTVQSEDDEVQLCWEENGFQTLQSRRSKVGELQVYMSRSPENDREKRSHTSPG